MRRTALALIGIAAWTSVSLAPLSAQGAVQAGLAPSTVDLAAQAARRYPQAVVVGTLIGRDLLGPEEAQPILGRVSAVVRNSAGSLEMLVRRRGLFGFSSGFVAVPADAVALLGEYVALVGLTPDQLKALPIAGAGQTGLAAGEVIRLGLVKPFH